MTWHFACTKVKKLISEVHSELIFTYDPPNHCLEPPLQDKNSFVMLWHLLGTKNGKKHANNGQYFWPFFGPLQAPKHY